ncbi:hypothetical protein XI06_15505 [Bradyrhizobium sp. CCBAU 11434]|nr:hypothetical protein [Bradyrhizobium sp. CCBAU 11434]
MLDAFLWYTGLLVWGVIAAAGATAVFCIALLERLVRYRAIQTSKQPTSTLGEACKGRAHTSPA